MPTSANPFAGPPPSEVPLAEAPLVAVLAQVRFPQVLSIEQDEFVARFQEAVRSQYPVLRKEQNLAGLLLVPMTIPGARTETAWRFQDLKAEWRVTLTPSFITLESRRYTSRTDFFDRFRVVIAALEKYVEPKLVDRIGVRYVDRLVAPAFEQLDKLVRPELVGVLGTELAGDVEHCLSEMLLQVGQDKLLSRWGRLPPGQVVDPSVMDPVDGASWILDLDVFNATPVPFKGDEVVARARGYAEKIYSFFRWAVTDDFLRMYGGKP